MRRVWTAALTILLGSAIGYSDTIIGKVVAPDGSPVAGATISVAYGRGPGMRPPETIKSDPNGGFTVDRNEPPLPVGLRAMMGDRVTPTATLVDQPTTQPVILKLADNAMGSVTERVVDAKGTPIANATVIVIARMTPSPFGISIPPGGTTGSDGRFDVGSLWPDADYFISVRQKGYGWQRREFLLNPVHHVSLSDIILRQLDSSIAGVLLNAGGNPVPNCQIIVEGPLTGVGRVTTDSAGKFHDDVMSGDRLMISVPPIPGSPGMTQQSVKAGDENIVVHASVNQLMPNENFPKVTPGRLRQFDSSIAGVLLNAGGNPIPNCQIIIEGPLTGADRLTTDSAGKFHDDVMSSDGLLMIFVPPFPGSPGMTRQSVKAGDEKIVVHVGIDQLIPNENFPRVTPGRPPPPPPLPLTIVMTGDAGVLNIWNYVYGIMAFCAMMIALVILAAVVQQRRRSRRNRGAGELHNN